MLVSVTATGALASSEHIKVMTQNQYLGADLTPIVGAPDDIAFNAAVIAALQEIAANNYKERSRELASTITNRQPHIVGLQEVYEFTCEDFGSGNCAFFEGAFNDHLSETMDVLAEQGNDYYVAAIIENLTLPPPGLPIPGLPVHLDTDGIPDLFIGVVDRDVILARNDVETSVVNFACARPTQDGCHFNTVAQLSTLIGPINIERGFVAVEAIVDDASYRVVNTHLEVQLPSSNPLSATIQAAQASELIGTMSLQPPPAGTKLIVVGDFNSSPDDTRFPDPTTGPFHTPYQQFVNGTDLLGNPISLEYTDTWNMNRPGASCCQDAELLNAKSELYERIDIIFALEAPQAAQSNFLGIYPGNGNKTPSGLWPSDHGILFGRLIYK
jgi:hypothetical protein